MDGHAGEHRNDEHRLRRQVEALLQNGPGAAAQDQGPDRGHRHRATEHEGEARILATRDIKESADPGRVHHAGHRESEPEDQASDRSDLESPRSWQTSPAHEGDGRDAGGEGGRHGHDRPRRESRKTRNPVTAGAAGAHPCPEPDQKSGRHEEKQRAMITAVGEAAYSKRFCADEHYSWATTPLAPIGNARAQGSVLLAVRQSSILQLDSIFTSSQSSRRCLRLDSAMLNPFLRQNSES